MALMGADKNPAPSCELEMVVQNLFIFMLLMVD